jgi:hypothetical protein
MDSSHWSNGIRYHVFDTRPDTEFKTRAFQSLQFRAFNRSNLGTYERPLTASVHGHMS